MADPQPRSWKPCEPAAAAGWLAGLDTPWWIAGGWAIELFCGHATRPHADLDVGCFREDLAAVRACLPGWTVCSAREGVLRGLEPGEAPDADVHSLWCRPEGAAAWWLELMLDEREGDEWVYRRCPEIRLPARDLFVRARDGTPHLRPEVQLLYKARHRRPRDDEDLEAAAPLLDPPAARWLREALERSEPGHPWLEPLSRLS